MSASLNVRFCHDSVALDMRVRKTAIVVSIPPNPSQFTPMTTTSEASGSIVQTWKDGQRILWTYVPELPAEDTRRAMPWLTVLRWEYNGSDSEGMPAAEENQHMLMLDVALGKIERPDFCVEGYRRIGAGLREFRICFLYRRSRQVPWRVKSLRWK